MIAFGSNSNQSPLIRPKIIDKRNMLAPDTSSVIRKDELNESSQFGLQSRIGRTEQRKSQFQQYSINSPNTGNEVNISAPTFIFNKGFDTSPDHQIQSFQKDSKQYQQNNKGHNPQQVLKTKKTSNEKSIDKSREIKTDKKAIKNDKNHLNTKNNNRNVSNSSTPNNRIKAGPTRSTTMHQKQIAGLSLGQLKTKGKLQKKQTIFRSSKQLIGLQRNESSDKSFIGSNVDKNMTPQRKSQLEDFIKVVNEKREILNKRKQQRNNKHSVDVNSSQKSEFLKKVKARKSIFQMASSSSSDSNNRNLNRKNKSFGKNSQEHEFLKGFKLLEQHRKVSVNEDELSNEIITNMGVKRIVNVRNFFQEAGQKDDETQLQQLQAQINNQSLNASQINTLNNNNSNNINTTNYKSLHKNNIIHVTNSNTVNLQNLNNHQRQSKATNFLTPIQLTKKQSEKVYSNNTLYQHSLTPDLLSIQNKNNDSNSSPGLAPSIGSLNVPSPDKRKLSIKRRRSFIGSSGIIEEIIDRVNKQATTQPHITPKFEPEQELLQNQKRNQVPDFDQLQLGNKKFSIDIAKLPEANQQNGQLNNLSMLSIIQDDLNSNDNSLENKLKLQLDMSSKPVTVDLGNQSSRYQEKDENNNDNQTRRQLDFSLIDEQVLGQKIQGFLINPAAFWKTIWNAIILTLIMFLAVTVPYRISFEDSPTNEWFMLDMWIDCIFIVDLTFNFLTAYEDENGILVTSHKRIALSYIKTWFLIDLMSCIPITAIQQYGGLGAGVANVKFIKLSRLPRLYRLLRLVKLIRLYKSNKIVEKFLNAINITSSVSQMVNSLVIMIFLLHLIGCLWATVASFSSSDYPQTWQSSHDLVNKDAIDIYISAVFWAAVTILTVGYGDLVPQNDFEVAVNIVILFVGVSLYAYFFSKLSTLFSSVNSQAVNVKTRDAIVTELAQTHSFGQDLTNKILYFFSQNSNLISLSKEYAIDELLRILPAHLKAEISYFLYKDAIEKLKILQGQDQRFYAEFISKFEPMRIKNGTIFAKEGQCPQEVFFLLKGCVQCQKQNKFYLEGTIFGEVEILLKKNRIESYQAKGDCYILKLDRSIFEQILDEFPKIREEIQVIVVEREKNRIENMQQAKIKQDVEQDKKDLQNLMSKINFESISAQRQGLLKRKSTISVAEFQQTFGNQQSLTKKQKTNVSQKQLTTLHKLQSPQSSKYDIMSFGLNSPHKNATQNPNIEEIKKIQNDYNSQLLVNDSIDSSTYREKDSLETIEDRNSEEDDEDDDLYEEMKKANRIQTNSTSQNNNNKNDKRRSRLQNLDNSSINNIQPYTGSKQSIMAPSMDDQNDQNNTMQSSCRADKKMIFIQNVESVESRQNSQRLQNRISNHMSNIELLRQSQYQVISGQPLEVDSKIVMDTLINTKNKIKTEQLQDQEHELIQLQYYQQDEIAYGTGQSSQRLSSKEYSIQIRQSLQRIQESMQEEIIVRPTTHRDLPVSMPNKTQQLNNILQQQQEQPRQQQQTTQNYHLIAQSNFSNEMLIQQNLSSRNHDSQMTETTIAQMPSIVQSNAPTPSLMFYHPIVAGQQSNVTQDSLLMPPITRYQEMLNKPVAPTPEQLDIDQLKPILEDDLMRLNQHVKSCQSSIQITRRLILEYCNLFESTIEQQGEEGNEIIKRQYIQGIRCLESYVNIMNMIEKLISQINIEQLSTRITHSIHRTNESEKRFYFLENKVKVMNAILDERIRKLQRDKEHILAQRPVLIVRRNPLLDDRDSKHAKLNENLVFSSNKEMNL